MACIDYRKAFDSIPHSLIERIQKMFHLGADMVIFFVVTMKIWKTKIAINTNNPQVNKKTIEIKTGIFQSNSLSPEVFCMTRKPFRMHCTV